MPTVQLNTWSASVLVLILSGLVGWTAYENIQSLVFRSQGLRCTESRCDMGDYRIEMIEIEHRRLQCQVDRLEGHECTWTGLE